MAGAGAEHEQRGVHRSGRVVVHLRVERFSEAVGGEEVQPAIAHECGHVDHGVEDALHGRADTRLNRVDLEALRLNRYAESVIAACR